jgi:hypothetical protein
MLTKLEQLDKSIDPYRTIEQIKVRVNHALNTFELDSTVVHKWDDFLRILARCYRHVENVVLRVNPPLPPNFEFDWGRCNPLLDKLYWPGGIKAAMEIAQSGVEGGLRRVLNDLGMQMAIQYAENEISAKVNHYLKGLSIDEKFAAMDEYLKKYGHLLSAEFTEGSAIKIRANFRKVLEEHPHMLMRLRNIARPY